MDDNLFGYIPRETMLVPTNPTTYLLPTQNFSSTLSPPIIKDCHLTASGFIVIALPKVPLWYSTLGMRSKLATKA